MAAQNYEEGALTHSAIAKLVGLSTTDTIGFYGTTPVAQRANAAQAQVVVTTQASGNGFGFTTSAQIISLVGLVNEMQTVLVNLGLMKGGA